MFISSSPTFCSSRPYSAASWPDRMSGSDTISASGMPARLKSTSECVDPAYTHTQRHAKQLRVGTRMPGNGEWDAPALRHSFTRYCAWMEAEGLTSESAPWWSILAESSSMCSRVIPTTLPLGSSRLPRPPKGVCTSATAKKQGSTQRQRRRDTGHRGLRLAPQAGKGYSALYRFAIISDISF